MNLTKPALITVGVLLLIGCEPRKPDFVRNGKSYRIDTHCEEYKTETKFEYHYGFWMGKWCWHLGPRTVKTCVLYKTDTTEMKQCEQKKDK